jgi:hypothetical protein
METQKNAWNHQPVYIYIHIFDVHVVNQWKKEAEDRRNRWWLSSLQTAHRCMNRLACQHMSTCVGVKTW